MKISLCLAVWNTSHLLARSIYTYMAQEFPREDWELIVIDDSSDDDVQSVIAPADGVINVRYVRLDHDWGMRGNTVSFNTAFEMAKGDVIAETTPETMFQTNVIETLYRPHASQDRAFVAMKTYQLTPQIQKVIDTVDWKKDLMQISQLPGWHCPWVQANVSNDNFRTHQTCSIRKKTFYEITDGEGFPLFGDYGSEDPWYSGRREQRSINDITIMDPMPIHQWHTAWQYWIAMGRAPQLNMWAHSMSNYLQDDSGLVPDGGTCAIWDGRSHEQMSDDAKALWIAACREDMLATGVPEWIVMKEQ